MLHSLARARRHVVASCLALLLGCGGGKTPQGTTPTGGGGDGPATPVEPAFDVAQLGAACGEAGECQPGTSCAKYYGIAGPSGPEFSSCEVVCSEDKGACPAGTTCVTIADGPGAVCRADAAPDDAAPPAP